MTALPPIDGKTPLPGKLDDLLPKKTDGTNVTDHIDIWTGGSINGKIDDLNGIFGLNKPKDPFDINKDGKIDEAEQAAKDAYDKAQEKMKFDVDGDGKLSDAELAAYDAYKKAGGKIEPNKTEPGTNQTEPLIADKILIDGPGGLTPEEAEKILKDDLDKSKDLGTNKDDTDPNESETITVLIDGPGGLTPEEAKETLKKDKDLIRLDQEPQIEKETICWNKTEE